MTERAEKQYVPDALTEARDWYMKAANMPEVTSKSIVTEHLLFAQVAAFIAIAEALTEKKDGR